MKKVYAITIESVQEYEAYIQADSPEDAQKIAEEIMTHDSIECVVAFGNPADERIKPLTPVTVVEEADLDDDMKNCVEENLKKLEEAREN